MDSASRLPIVREPRYVTTTTPMQALAVTVRRGAALMAAGAIARIVLKQVGEQLLKSGASLPTTKASSPATTAQSPEIVEEVVYFRRRLYRRG